MQDLGLGASLCVTKQEPGFERQWGEQVIGIRSLGLSHPGFPAGTSTVLPGGDHWRRALHTKSPGRCLAKPWCLTVIYSPLKEGPRQSRGGRVVERMSYWFWFWFSLSWK